MSKKIKLNFTITGGEVLSNEIPVNDGADAFTIYKQIKGNENKTPDDFFDYIRGHQGVGVSSVTSEVETSKPPINYRYQIVNPKTMVLGEYENDGSTYTGTESFTLKRTDGKPFDQDDIDKYLIYSSLNCGVMLNLQWKDANKPAVVGDTLVDIIVMSGGVLPNATSSGKPEVFTKSAYYWDPNFDTGLQTLVPTFEINFQVVPDLRIDTVLPKQMILNHYNLMDPVWITNPTTMESEWLDSPSFLSPDPQMWEAPQIYTANEGSVEKRYALPVISSMGGNSIDPQNTFDPLLFNGLLYGMTQLDPSGMNSLNSAPIEIKFVKGSEYDAEFDLPETVKADSGISGNVAIPYILQINDKDGTPVPLVTYSAIENGPWVLPSEAIMSGGSVVGEDGLGEGTFQWPVRPSKDGFEQSVSTAFNIGSLDTPKTLSTKIINYFGVVSFEIVKIHTFQARPINYEIEIVLKLNPDHVFQVPVNDGSGVIANNPNYGYSYRSTLDPNALTLLTDLTAKITVIVSAQLGKDFILYFNNIIIDDNKVTHGMTFTLPSAVSSEVPTETHK